MLCSCFVLQSRPPMFATTLFYHHHVALVQRCCIEYIYVHFDCKLYRIILDDTIIDISAPRLYSVLRTLYLQLLKNLNTSNLSEDSSIYRALLVLTQRFTASTHTRACRHCSPVLLDRTAAVFLSSFRCSLSCCSCCSTYHPTHSCCCRCRRIKRIHNKTHRAVEWRPLLAPVRAYVRTGRPDFRMSHSRLCYSPCVCLCVLLAIGIPSFWFWTPVSTSSPFWNWMCAPAGVTAESRHTSRVRAGLFCSPLSTFFCGPSRKQNQGRPCPFPAVVSRFVFVPCTSVLPPPPPPSCLCLAHKMRYFQ